MDADMPAVERWTPETEELVARRICSVDGSDWEICVRTGVEAFHLRDARDVLAALAEAGLLLPPGGDGQPRFGRSMGEGWGYLEVMERGEATHQRMWTTWPDGSEHFTPWVEVTPDA